jgi:alkylated DNA repair dioxygenase AlkB
MELIHSQTFTLTFSESIENHTGMQVIGTRAEKGFSVEYLHELSTRLGGECIELGDDSRPDACIVIFRDGLHKLCGIHPDELYLEQHNLKKDTKCMMYGRVVNKRARHNLCFADMNQEPDYENRKGTVLDFNTQPVLSKVRQSIHEVFGDECKNLYCEGNYYYDIKKTYIGWHGDTERSKVIGVRLGADFPLHFRWYDRGKECEEIHTFTLRHGDMYIMSHKATGTDWKKRSLRWTLRHSAGMLKNIN